MTSTGAVQPLFSLTDEQVAVLAGTGDGAVAMPHLEALGEQERAVAVHTAYRCLLASGLVTLPAADRADAGVPAAPEEDGAGVAVELPAEVDAVLVLREAAPVLLLVQRTAGEEEVLRYGYLADDVVLWEDVLPSGLHRFGRVGRDELGDCVQQFLVPDEATMADRSLTVDPAAGVDGAGEVESVLARAVVHADLTVRHAGDDGPGDLLGMFLGAEGSWVSCQRFGAGGPVTFDPLDPGTVQERVLRLVTAAERAVEGVVDGGA
ncbi:MAG TPA: hypothetical protein VFJ12_05380 [Segeticoccus sp.]|nr:hypothetical protein [Segeticoccus sp.]